MSDINNSFERHLTKIKEAAAAVNDAVDRIGASGSLGESNPLWTDYDRTHRALQKLVHEGQSEPGHLNVEGCMVELVYAKDEAGNHRQPAKIEGVILRGWTKYQIAAPTSYSSSSSSKGVP